MRAENKLKEQSWGEVQKLRQRMAEQEAVEVRRKHKRMEPPPEESEQRYKFLIDHSKEIILIINRRGKITFVNKSTLANYGYSQEEIIGKSITRFLTGGSIKKALYGLAQEFLGRPQREMELEARTKSGEIRYLCVAEGSVPVYENGKLIGVMISASDITDRKKAEEAIKRSEEHFRDLVEKAGIAISIDDQDGELKYSNERYAEMFGYSAEEMKKLPIRLMIHPDDVEKVMTYHLGRLQGKDVPSRYEFKGIRKDGAVIDIEVDVVILRDEERLIGTRAYMWDITERKKTEEVLEKRRTRLELVHHIQSEIPLNTDIETVLVRAAESIGQSFDYYKISVNLYHRETEEIEYLTGWNKTGQLIPRGHRQKLGQGLIGKAGLLKKTIVANDVSKEPDYFALLSDTKSELIIPLLVKDELIGVLDLQATRVNAFSKEDVSVLQAIANYCAYIIDERQREEALRKSEERFRSVVEYSYEGIFIVDNAFRILYANDELTRIAGYSREEIIDQDFRKFLDDESQQLVVDHYIRRQRGEKVPSRYEFNIVRKNGEKRRVEISSTVMRDTEGKVETIAQILDITERKRSELLQDAVYQISQSANSAASLDDLYKSVHEIISIVMLAKNFYIALYDPPSKLLSFPYFSDEYDETPAPQKLGKGLTEYVLHTAKPLLCDEATDKELRRRGEVELVGTPTAIWLGVPLIVEDRAIGVMVVQDYSDPKAYGERELRMLEYVSSQVAKAIETKRAEEILRKSEAHYRTLVETSPDAIALSDLQGKILICNQQAAVLHELKSSEEIIGTSFFDWIAPEDRARAVDDARKTMESASVGIIEYSMLRADGSSFPAELRMSLVKDAQGNPLAMIGIIRDITERKRAETALQESERKLRLLAENMRDAVFIYDLDRRLQYVNPGVERLTGYSIREFHERNFIDYLHPEDRGRMMDLWEKLFQGKAFSEEEFRIVTKDGQTKWCSSSWGPLLDEKGHQVGIQGREIDVTESKWAKEILQESEMKYRALFEYANDAVFILDSEGKHVMANEKAASMLGYSVQELIGMSAKEVVAASEYPSAQDKLNGVLKGKVYPPYERIFRKKDGTEFPVEINIALLPVREGSPQYIQSIVRDITERKRLDNELQQTSDRLRQALGSIVKVVASTVELRDPYTAGHQKRVADLTRAIATEIGLSKDQIEGIRIAATIHDLGKIFIPGEILSKPGKLSENEYSLIRLHPQVGFDILKDITFPWPIAQIVYQHHERMDGSGYPQGLTGKDILLEARILAVADVVEAMSSHRPYRPALGHEAALKEILEKRDILYDPEVVDVCVELFTEKRFEFE
jgi:PAS domain S-box-containing protein